MTRDAYCEYSTNYERLGLVVLFKRLANSKLNDRRIPTNY